ncbi:outer membrane protein assembly factor BamD [Yunchengibacter salinarum]|uniref:outer membrane protein assembly factor BamD n=1 Tax=Yunchengibacter salinarum TaxID=3133399 RepID=UPI0035B67689
MRTLVSVITARHHARLLGLALLLGLTACSGDDPDRYVARDVEVIYNLAKDNLERGNYKLAAAAFDEVERQHPYSIWARRAQLMAAYSNYMANQYEDSVLAAERFLSLHPGNRQAPYAYYLIALSHYERITDVRRDQSQTHQARDALREVIRRYPGTEYARDAQLKLDLTNDHLAGKDMEVGRFYLKRKEYLAAAKRFSSVIQNYQTTSHVPEALHRLVEAYLAMGVMPEARKTAAVLGHNYPGTKWYEHSYRLLEERQLRPATEVDPSIFDVLLPF